MTLASVGICDGDLVQLARTGDAAAFRLFVERHRAMARAHAVRLCEYPDDVDDIAASRRRHVRA
jgi:DNA-directed RNA polymerase specialized sigma24 family protein